MNPYGDGSNGALNVTGITSLPLDTKLQYTTVNVAPGATITTSSTQGSVLYITATQSITINGTVDVANKVLPGQRGWSTVIDGVTYSTPSTGRGGSGRAYANQADAIQGAGFGGGGGGDTSNDASNGSGGSGSITGGSGGGRVYREQTGTSFKNVGSGNNAGASGGGSGFAHIEHTGAGSTVYKMWVTSGRGGNAYGENGEDGVSGGIQYISGSGGGTYAWTAGGGGGAGGSAGKSGVHVVLISPTITINGTVITTGTSGQKGGNGGRRLGSSGLTNIYGMPGGGGGGGNAGNITLKYASSLTDNGTYLMLGGAGGAAGVGGLDNSYSGGTGTAGLAGAKTVAQLPPTAGFTATPVTGNRPLEVTFTNASVGATTYNWNFGDSSGSSQANPVHTYSDVGTYTVTLTATNDAGSSEIVRSAYITATVASYSRSAGGTLLLSGGVERKLLASRSAGGTLLFGGGARAVVLREAESLQDKTYLYKVYDPEGNYVEILKDVVSDPSFTHEINSIGSTMTMELARNSDSVGVSTGPILDSASQAITTNAGQPILANLESRNQIGPGSSIDYNNRVDVYVYYGQVAPLLTSDGEEILTNAGEPILVQQGAPNGRRIFTGFISEINSRYGNSESTVVQLTSYGFDLDQYPITTTATGNVTTVPFNSYDPSEIVETAMDRFIERSSLEQVTYTTFDETSVGTTGTVVSYTFRNDTFKNVLDKTLELMPPNWYYRIGLGDNILYYRERSVTAQHLFYLGKHIKALDLKGSILDAVNHVLFTGGGDPALYIETKEAPAARVRRGLEILSDARVTLQTSAEIISEGKIDERNKSQSRSTIEILSKQYDIESINVGETVGFRNFNNYVDELVMQIVGLTYYPDFVQLQLETKPPTINKRLADLYRNMVVQENQNIPGSPL